MPLAATCFIAICAFIAGYLLRRAFPGKVQVKIEERVELVNLTRRDRKFLRESRVKV